LRFEPIFGGATGEDGHDVCAVLLPERSRTGSVVGEGLRIG